MYRSIPATLALAASLLVAGCAATSTTEPEGDASMAPPSASASAMSGPDSSAASPAMPDGQPDSDAEAMATEGAWIDQADYEGDPAAFHESGDVVLFFAATWCPTCQASVASLDEDGVPAGLTVVRVDYDSQTELKKQYGVTVQHTYVQVDESGNPVAKWTGSVSGEDIAAKTV